MSIEFHTSIAELFSEPLCSSSSLLPYPTRPDMTVSIFGVQNQALRIETRVVGLTLLSYIRQSRNF